MNANREARWRRAARRRMVRLQVRIWLKQLRLARLMWGDRLSLVLPPICRAVFALLIGAVSLPDAIRYGKALHNAMVAHRVAIAAELAGKRRMKTLQAEYHRLEFELSQDDDNPPTGLQAAGTIA